MNRRRYQTRQDKKLSREDKGKQYKRIGTIAGIGIAGAVCYWIFFVFIRT